MLQKLSVRLSSLIFHNMRTLSNTVCPFCSGRRYYSLNDYCKETFGEKVYRLSLSGGMTEPTVLLDVHSAAKVVPVILQPLHPFRFRNSCRMPKYALLQKPTVQNSLHIFSPTQTLMHRLHICVLFTKKLYSHLRLSLYLLAREVIVWAKMYSCFFPNCKKNIRTSRYGLSLDYRRCTTTHCRK